MESSDDNYSRKRRISIATYPAFSRAGTEPPLTQALLGPGAARRPSFRVVTGSHSTPLTQPDGDDWHRQHSADSHGASSVTSDLPSSVDAESDSLHGTASHDFERCVTGATAGHETASVVSVTEGQLANVFQYLTHYFVAMYVLEMGGQLSTLIAELLFTFGGFESDCFESEMLLLDMVFVLLLLVDVGLSLHLAGWAQYMKRCENRVLMQILVLSILALAMQAFKAMSQSPMLIVDVIKTLLRVTRVAVFYRKLQVVMNSPLSHWDVHSDILNEEENHH